jgi:hypothetical protein
MNEFSKKFCVTEMLYGFNSNWVDYEPQDVMVAFTWIDRPGCAYDDLNVKYELSDMTSAEHAWIENFLISWFFKNFEKEVKCAPLN